MLYLHVDANCQLTTSIVALEVQDRTRAPVAHELCRVVRVRAYACVCVFMCVLQGCSVGAPGHIDAKCVPPWMWDTAMHKTLNVACASADICSQPQSCFSRLSSCTPSRGPWASRSIARRIRSHGRCRTPLPVQDPHRARDGRLLHVRHPCILHRAATALQDPHRSGPARLLHVHYGAATATRVVRR